MFFYEPLVEIDPVVENVRRVGTLFHGNLAECLACVAAMMRVHESFGSPAEIDYKVLFERRQQIRKTSLQIFYFVLPKRVCHERQAYQALELIQIGFKLRP